MSRPCVNCVKRLVNLPNYSGYRIRNVYYTTAPTGHNNNTAEREFTVTKIRLNHLVSQTTQYSCRFKSTSGVARIGSQWRARPYHEGRYQHLGYYPTAREAADAVREFISETTTNNSTCSHNHHHHHHDCGEEDGHTSEDDTDG